MKHSLFGKLFLGESRTIKDYSSLEEKNFGLSENQFIDLAVRLKLGDDKLFEMIFLSHFGSCLHYLMKQFELSFEKAYDISMNTIIQFRKKIIEDKIIYGNLRFLFTKMATQIHVKQELKYKKENTLSSLFLNDKKHEENAFEALEKSWQLLEGIEKDILEQFYYYKIPLKQLAEQHEITASYMRKKKQRSLEKLRSIFISIYKEKK